MTPRRHPRPATRGEAAGIPRPADRMPFATLNPPAIPRPGPLGLPSQTTARRLGIALLLVLALLAGGTLALDFHRRGRQLEGRLQLAKARLAEVRQLAARLGPAAPGTDPPAVDGSVLARIDACLREAGLADHTRRLEPQRGEVRVELAPHDWAALAGLLEGLAAARLEVLQARIEAAGPPGNAADGRVRAQLRVAAPSGDDAGN